MKDQDDCLYGGRRGRRQAPSMIQDAKRRLRAREKNGGGKSYRKTENTRMTQDGRMILL